MTGNEQLILLERIVMEHFCVCVYESVCVCVCACMCNRCIACKIMMIIIKEVSRVFHLVLVQSASQ